MKTNFTPAFFKANREKLRQSTNCALMIFTANGLLQRNGDNAYPFRQDSSFWYLCGCEDQDLILVLDETEEYLIIPAQTDYQQLFDGTIDTSSLSSKSGIRTILTSQQGWERLEKSLKRVKQAGTLHASPTYVETYGMYTNPARQNLVDRLNQLVPDMELIDLRPELARLRSIKQAEELNALQHAINMTIDSVNRIKDSISYFKYEYEIEAEITHHFLKNGAKPVWKPMVAAGKNASILHYMAASGRLRKNELVLVDIGAEVENYAADISRTFSTGGKASKRQQSILEAVSEVQQYAYSLLKPGAFIRENEKLVEQFMGQKLQQLGLINKIERDSVRRYYGHATSHYLGLDPHDVGDYGESLQAGMVLTVEPGIYIPEESIGVRIEDDVLIANEGIEILSSRLPALLD